MSIVLLALVAALQTQAAPPLIPVVALTPARPAPTSTPTPPSTPAPAVAEASAEVEAAPEAEPVADQPKTRQSCRFVEVPGRRFPERRCRTVVIADDR